MLADEARGQTFTTSNLKAFSESHSSSSFDVTIEGGEAFVVGAYLAIDTQTTVTLSSSTNNQTVYLGWTKGKQDDVKIGKSGAFASDDRKIPIWDFDTDGSGVTSSTDRRNLDSFRVRNEDVQALQNLTGDETFSAHPFVSSDIATDAVGPSEIASSAVGRSELAQAANLYVADGGSTLLYIYDISNDSWSASSTQSGVDNESMAADGAGNVYLLDPGSDLLRIYDIGADSWSTSATQSGLESGAGVCSGVF